MLLISVYLIVAALSASVIMKRGADVRNVENVDRKTTLSGEPWSAVQMDIYGAGDLFEYGKALG